MTLDNPSLTAPHMSPYSWVLPIGPVTTAVTVVWYRLQTHHHPQITKTEVELSMATYMVTGDGYLQEAHGTN